MGWVVTLQVLTHTICICVKSKFAGGGISADWSSSGPLTGLEITDHLDTSTSQHNAFYCDNPCVFMWMWTSVYDCGCCERGPQSQSCFQSDQESHAVLNVQRPRCFLLNASDCWGQGPAVRRICTGPIDLCGFLNRCLQRHATPLLSQSIMTALTNCLTK